jgi:hypothetical protein
MRRKSQGLPEKKRKTVHANMVWVPILSQRWLLAALVQNVINV